MKFLLHKHKDVGSIHKNPETKQNKTTNSGYVLVIPALGKLRHADLSGWLVSQHSYFANCKSLCLNRKMSASSGMCTHILELSRRSYIRPLFLQNQYLTWFALSKQVVMLHPSPAHPPPLSIALPVMPTFYMFCLTLLKGGLLSPGPSKALIIYSHSWSALPFQLPRRALYLTDVTTLTYSC